MCTIPPMNRYRDRFARYILVLGLLLTAGCGAREPSLATLSPDDLYSRGMEAYEERDWSRATRMLEYFVAQYLGDPRAPTARMTLGDLHMTRREYAIATTHYQRLVIDFPADPRALEARFNICEAYYRLSPEPALDQEYTVSALAHCQSVAENFPGTGESGTAQEHIDDLRWKLAKKVYDTGVFYFRRRAYDAAVVYFQEVLSQYPTSEHAPAALERLVETYGRIGYVEDAEEAKERLLSEYPDSPEAQEVAT